MLSLFSFLFFFQLYCDHRDLLVLSHSFLHAALPISKLAAEAAPARAAHRTTSGGVERVGEPLHRDHFHALVAAALRRIAPGHDRTLGDVRSEEHTSELQSQMRISYAVFCLKKKNTQKHTNITIERIDYIYNTE